MKTNFQRDIIQYTLKNIISIYEKINKAKKYNANINKKEKWEFPQPIKLWYLLSEYHRLPISHMEIIWQ